MDRVSVVSSLIDEVGYNASCRTLEVLFKTGAIYLYYFVPQADFDGLMAAESKASYFNQHIKTKYEYHRIAEPENRTPSHRRATEIGKCWAKLEACLHQLCTEFNLEPTDEAYLITMSLQRCLHPATRKGSRRR
jgi:hypothetical protein